MLLAGGNIQFVTQKQQRTAKNINKKILKKKTSELEQTAPQKSYLFWNDLTHQYSSTTKQTILYLFYSGGLIQTCLKATDAREKTSIRPKENTTKSTLKMLSYLALKLLRKRTEKKQHPLCGKWIIPWFSVCQGNGLAVARVPTVSLSHIPLWCH